MRKNAKKEKKLCIKNVNLKCLDHQRMLLEPNPMPIIRLGDGNFLPTDSSVLNSNEHSRQYFSMAAGLAESKRILKISGPNPEGFYEVEVEEKWRHAGKEEFEARNLEWYINWLDQLADQRAHQIACTLKMLNFKEAKTREMISKLKIFKQNELEYIQKISQSTFDFIHQFAVVTKLTCAAEDGSSKLVQLGLNETYAAKCQWNPSIGGGLVDGFKFLYIAQTQDWLGMCLNRMLVSIKPEKQRFFGVAGVEEPDIILGKISLDPGHIGFGIDLELT